MRAITRGPKFHWFGYYDKLEFDPTDRYVLGMEVDFEGRAPESTDLIRVGMVDTADDRWIELGQSGAWSWQQGCMLQWIPPSSTEVIWNDRDGETFVSRILDAADPGAGVRTLPRPIFCLSPDGTTAFCIDFRRIQDHRPGYGYPGAGGDPFVAEGAPTESGIWRMDLQTGESTLIFSIFDATTLGEPQSGDDVWHWLYHLLVSPDGSRLAFLHCSARSGGEIFCRMITTDLDGSHPYVLDSGGKTSHYDWRDSNHVLAWALHEEEYGFFLFTDQTPEVEQVGAGVMESNGHCTYLTDMRWILNDTYPEGDGKQNPYLFDTETETRYSLGRFPSPDAYRSEFRCDTHPRSSRDGRTVVIDSPHDGGRQMYLMDISSILDSVEI